MHIECCEEIFDDFKDSFAPIRSAVPPKEKGVYVIKIERRGIPPVEIIDNVKSLVRKLNWDTAEKIILERVSRLAKIEDCATIYIGSAGTNKESKNTLQNRYKELSAHRHTAMYPIWALLIFGWELKYGWVADKTPNDMEEQLKRKYMDKHNNKLPALVVK